MPVGYICGYIWSGYAGTTIVRGVNFASPQVDRVGQIVAEYRFSTIRRLLSLSCAANSRRILPRFSYKYATGAHRLKEQC